MTKHSSYRGYHLEKRGKGDSYRVQVSQGNKGDYSLYSETIHAKNATEAHRKAEEIRDRIKQGYTGDLQKLTVESYFSDYLDTVVVHEVQPSTFAGYKQKVESYVYPRIGSLRLSELTCAVIDKLYADLAKGGSVGQKKKGGRKGGKPLSPDMIRQVHAVLHKGLNRAVSHGIIGANPTQAATIPRLRRKEKEPLSSYDMARLDSLADTIDDRALACALLIGLHCAMRIGETLGLQWGDVSITDDSGTIAVRRALRTGTGGADYYTQTKTAGSVRTVSIDGRLRDFLIEYRAWQKDLLRELGIIQTNKTPIILNARGSVMQHSNMYRIVKRFAQDNKFPDSFTYHILRHTHITYELMAGVPLKTVSERAGHSSIALTADTYGHILKGADAAAADTFGEVVKKAKADAEKIAEIA